MKSFRIGGATGGEIIINIDMKKVIILFKSETLTFYKYN
jgi:hypothetical protein